MPRWPAIATLLSMLACYGTLAALAALGALGVTLTLNTGLWAAAIVGFALLAVVALIAGRRRHGSLIPSLVATTGCAAVAYSSLMSYSVLVEAAGFALLCAAVWLDWRQAV